MNKVYVQNLGMIITNKCNLNCKHCLRGCKNQKSMSREVVDTTLNQILAIGNLCICGGEPTLALNELEYIFKYIVDNKILLDLVSIVINGTNYSKDFLDLLNFINNYISNRNNKGAIFSISYDKYHYEELKRLDLLEIYFENVEKYLNSEYFYDFSRLSENLKLFREGNAKKLDKKLTVKLKPIKTLVTYVNNDKKFDKDGLCNIGPLLTVNTDGIVTECDSDLESQNTKYNYGNIFEKSLEEIALERGKIVTPKMWNIKTNKLIKKYSIYNK